MPTRSRKSAIHESSDSPTAGPDQLVVHAPAPDEPGMHPPAGPPPERRIESWPIAVLKPHDQQTALFHDLDGPEFDDLVESMGAKGFANRSGPRRTASSSTATSESAPPSDWAGPKSRSGCATTWPATRSRSIARTSTPTGPAGSSIPSTTYAWRGGWPRWSSGGSRADLGDRRVEDVVRPRGRADGYLVAAMRNVSSTSRASRCRSRRLTPRGGSSWWTPTRSRGSTAASSGGSPRRSRPAVTPPRSSLRTWRPSSVRSSRRTPTSGWSPSWTVAWTRWRVARSRSGRPRSASRASSSYSSDSTASIGRSRRSGPGASRSTDAMSRSSSGARPRRCRRWITNRRRPIPRPARRPS